MKKLIGAAAIACCAAFANAATVSWTNMGMAAANGDYYAMFAVGANGVTSIATITDLLNTTTPAPGKAWSEIQSYALGYGTVANGQAGSAAGTVLTTNLGEGTYQAFMVVFDSATPAPGAGKYAVLSGASGYAKEVGASTPSVIFQGGNLTTTLSSATWNNYGVAAPEPTSGILLLLGMAGLALKRKRA